MTIIEMNAGCCHASSTPERHLSSDGRQVGSPFSLPAVLLARWRSPFVVWVLSDLICSNMTRLMFAKASVPQCHTCMRNTRTRHCTVLSLIDRRRGWLVGDLEAPRRVEAHNLTLLRKDLQSDIMVTETGLHSLIHWFVFIGRNTSPQRGNVLHLTILLAHIQGFYIYKYIF